MQKFGQAEAQMEVAPVKDANPDATHVGEIWQRVNCALPAEVHVLARIHPRKITSGFPGRGKSLHFRLRHYHLREHRRTREILGADDGLEVLTMQTH